MPGGGEEGGGGRELMRFADVDGANKLNLDEVPRGGARGPGSPAPRWAAESVTLTVNLTLILTLTLS